MLKLRWKTSFSASCLHAAACMRDGLPIADHRIATVLVPAVEALDAELVACGLSDASIYATLVSLAADFENNRSLVERATSRIVGAGALGGAAISRLAGCITDLEAAWLREQPALVDELDVRVRPLREHWEARGPGLMRAIQRLTEDDFLVSSADVVLVSPVVGGHARAHLRTNRVTFEAVLANSMAELPETLRLAWALAQLNVDLPKFSEPIPQARLSRLACLALLPLVLTAAEAVELARLDEPTVALAIDAWHVPTPLPADAASTLIGWWQTCTTSDARWPVALSALDQMLGD